MLGRRVHLAEVTDGVVVVMPLLEVVAMFACRMCQLRLLLGRVDVSYCSSVDRLAEAGVRVGMGRVGRREVWW